MQTLSYVQYIMEVPCSISLHLFDQKKVKIVILWNIFTILNNYFLFLYILNVIYYIMAKLKPVLSVKWRNNSKMQILCFLSICGNPNIFSGFFYE